MTYHINESEYRLMEILWEEEPVNSMELVRICASRLDWKKSTTYTVIRKLSQKQIQKQESNEFLKRKFGGSLPSFITAYLQDKKLTKDEAEKLKKLIQDAAEDDD